MSSTDTSRRALLGATLPAVLALASGPAGAAPQTVPLALARRLAQPETASAGGPDADLVALCRTAEAAYARYCAVCADNDGDELPALREAWRAYEARLYAMAKIPAMGACGLATKAVLLRRIVTDGEADCEADLLLSLCGDATRFLEAPAAAGPDDALIAMCAEHRALAAELETAEFGDAALCEHPLWPRYVDVLDAIALAEPRTLAGVLARAASAKVEAACPSGGDDPEGTAGAGLAWATVNALLRLFPGLVP